MVNILPKKTQHALTARYYANLAATFFVFVGLAVLVGGGLLAPSYLLSLEEAKSAERFKNAVLERLTILGDTGASRDVSVLAAEVDLMNEYHRAPLSDRIFSSLLAALPQSVSLNKMSFTADDARRGRIDVSGTAATRVSLLEFVNALQANMFFRDVTVPVADLARDTNISFSFSFSYQTP